MGLGFDGVVNFPTSAWAPPVCTSVSICVRTSELSSPEIAATAPAMSSREGQRFSGSFSSMRMIACANAGGQSGTCCSTGVGSVCRWWYMTAIADEPSNGFTPASIR
jgi:hypothetical protein